MKKLVTFLLMACAVGGASAQKIIGSASFYAKLQLDPGDGTNACSVVYHPGKGLYYTFFAGNPEYPVQAFELSESLKESFVAGTWMLGFDARGVWWDPDRETIVGMSKGGEELYEFVPSDEDSISDAFGLGGPVPSPDINAVAMYDGSNYLGMMHLDTLHLINNANLSKVARRVPLAVPAGLALNQHAFAFTGISGKEVMTTAFDIDEDGTDLILVFFNMQGAFKGAVRINWYEWSDLSDLPIRFRISWSNGRFWAYDHIARCWLGFGISFN